jgi:hypothetical protein
MSSNTITCESCSRPRIDLYTTTKKFQKFGVNSVSENKKLVLQRFIQYVFRPETKILRESLIENVAEMAIYLYGNKGVSVSLVHNIVQNQMKINLEVSVLKEALESLIEKNIAIKKEEKYFLTKSRVKETDGIIKERVNFFKDIEKEFIKFLGKMLPDVNPEQERAGMQLLYECLASIFTNESKLVSSLLRLSPEDVEFIIDYKPPAELLKEVLTNIGDEKFGKCVGAAVVHLFGDPRFSEFLHIAAQNFIFFEVLNLDPQCRFIEREAFSEKTLLLDTNFIIALLLPSDLRHSIATKLAWFSRKLGITLSITKRTEEEVKDELEHSNTIFRRLGFKKPDILKSIDDEFIASYALEKERKPSLTWNEFYSKMKALHALLSKWAIVVFDVGDVGYEVSRSKLLPEVKSYVLTCCKEVTGRIKTEKVAEHDAYHILLVRKLRSAHQDVLGPKFWFLTFDNSLLCVDRAINKLTGSRYEAPSSMMGWAWLELIAPYFGTEVQENILSRAFASLMTSSFAAMPIRLSIADLLEIQSQEVNFENFSVEEIEELISDEFVQKYLKIVREARVARSSELQNYQEKLKEQVKKKSDAILEKRVGEELFWRRVSGSMSMISWVVGILCVLLNNILGALLLFITGGFFMGVAVGYKKIEMGLKRIRIKK